MFKTIRSALQHSMPNCARARTHTAFLFQSYSFLETDKSIAPLTCKACWALPVMTGNVELNCTGMLPLSISHSLVTLLTLMSLIYKCPFQHMHTHTPPSSFSLRFLLTVMQQPAALGFDEGECGIVEKNRKADLSHKE